MLGKTDEIKDTDPVSRLGTEPISKLLFEFAWPAIVGFIAIALYELVDRIFVGQVVGSYGLTIMAIGMPVVIIINALCIMLRAGVTSKFSHTLGSGNYGLANNVVGNVFLMAIFAGLLVFAILGTFAREVAILCAAEADTLADSVKYIQIISAGSIGLFVANCASVMMRTLGHPKDGMLLVVGSVVLNIILDTLFVVYLDYGVAGAAWGTVLAQFVGALYGIWYFIRNLNMNIKEFVLDLPMMGECTLLGIPLAAFEINYMICAVVINNLLGHYGTNEDLAIVPVFTSILNMLFMPIAGLDEGAQILIGYNYAAGNLQRVRKIIWQVIAVGVCLYTVSFLLVQLGAEYIVMIFDAHNPEFIKHAARATRIVLAVAPIMAIMHIVPGILTALGEIRYNFLLSVVLEILAQYPPLLILPLYWGVDGIFAAFPLYDIIFASMAILFLHKALKKRGIV